LPARCFANFGLVVAGSDAGLWAVDAAQGIVKSLGMGLMMGAGHCRGGKATSCRELAGILRGMRGCQYAEHR
jgi:hypothetical protein